MKAILLGIVLGILLIWPAALSRTADTAAALAGQPTATAFALGVLAGPGLARTVRGWRS
ncbi:hypothetical protein [Streptomyces sp.]|uniref:hypothetical protein n=1 Tax=Streptomyces sp. TaxID=1931 RepID=UPI002811EC22|nr:hypothetical protein [Streptomyces sp.]